MRCKYTFKRKFIRILNISLLLTAIVFLPSVAFSLDAQEKPMFCPSIKDLRKNGVYWIAGNNWRSYSESFSNKISSFLGAQWIGVQVGKIICLYTSDDKNFDFPISLEQIRSSIILEPEGGYWSTLIDDHKICHSANVFDCPFYVKKEEKIEDIYKAIEYNPTPLSDFD